MSPSPFSLIGNGWTTHNPVDPLQFGGWTVATETAERMLTPGDGM